MRWESVGTCKEKTGPGVILPHWPGANSRSPTGETCVLLRRLAAGWCGISQLLDLLDHLIHYLLLRLGDIGIINQLIESRQRLDEVVVTDAEADLVDQNDDLLRSICESLLQLR